ncbi:unnamed protein product [Zymoseptoria tritici ST99CH_1A5]|uniref:RRM domain-containing protein n=2 Tax=Zymoseptoria tritici TaxID=1047171 RepID=A0A2H1GKV8_ZYMTR|nr:unnamed protein product [Zymoseptoria tritici ST99CH_1E4]SMR56277.1 unnamed protein product [Zymoseptoria tritici ST99CH_3D1]SMY25459.1 unnamed protein product [Zymoseptoria tritici ST99CH_1A5]
MAYNQQYAYPGYNPQYAYPPGQSAQYAQQQQQQQQAYPTSTTPQIRNPFAPPPPPPTAYAGANAAFDPEYEQQVALWQSAYAQPPGARDKKGGKDDNANNAPLGQRGAAGTATGDSTAAGSKAGADTSNLTVVRKGGGEKWEDKSLLEWDPTQFRIMVGNLAGEVTDDSLAKAFAAYGVAKARVIRDKLSTKSKGYGFVSFTDAEMGFKAAREMSNKYIGSHPITIKRSRTDVKPVVKKDPRNNRGKNRGNNNNKDKEKNKDGKKNGADPLKANTGAGVEKKLPAKTPGGLKLLG